MSLESRLASTPRSKAQLRTELRAKRRDLSAEEVLDASAAVVQHLLRVPEVVAAGTVGTYLASRGEVDLRAFIADRHDAGVQITLPKTDGDRLTFVAHRPDDLLIPGRFGIDQPAGNEVVPFADHDVVVVPLVAFDTAANRLGQGGGFYDREIQSAASRPLLIGVAYQFQLVDRLPVEPHDESLDLVVTQDGVVARR